MSATADVSIEIEGFWTFVDSSSISARISWISHSSIFKSGSFSISANISSISLSKSTWLICLLFSQYDTKFEVSIGPLIAFFYYSFSYNFIVFF